MSEHMSPPGDQIESYAHQRYVRGVKDERKRIVNIIRDRADYLSKFNPTFAEEYCAFELRGLADRIEKGEG